MTSFLRWHGNGNGSAVSRALAVTGFFAITVG